MAAYICASMSGEDSIWVVDADRFVPLRVIPLPQGSRPGALAYNPREGALYCACQDSVEVLDLARGARARSLPLPGPDAAGIALCGVSEIQLLSNESSCIATLDAQDGALSSCVRQLSSNGVQSLDIPFCIYPGKGQVKINASASASCSITGAELFILGM